MSNNPANIKRVRIFNDTGVGFKTVVSDTETGVQIDCVTFISLDIRPASDIRAIIQVVDPIVDVIADAEIKNVCPCCGKEMEKQS